MRYLLLTDNEDGRLLVACADYEEMEKVGAAAVWSDGGVSAWPLPEKAIVADAALIEQLEEGQELHEISDAHRARMHIGIVDVSNV